MNPYSATSSHDSDGEVCAVGEKLISSLKRGMGNMTMQKLVAQGLVASCSLCHKPMPRYNPSIKNLLCVSCKSLKEERENIVVIESEKSKKIPVSNQEEKAVRIEPKIVL